MQHIEQKYHDLPSSYFNLLSTTSMYIFFSYCIFFFNLTPLPLDLDLGLEDDLGLD